MGDAVYQGCFSVFSEFIKEAYKTSPHQLSEIF